MTEAKRVRITPDQLATLLVLDAAMAALQTGANQLGGYLGLKDEAEILTGAIAFVGSRRDELQRQWSAAAQVAQPGDVAQLVTP